MEKNLVLSKLYLKSDEPFQKPLPKTNWISKSIIYPSPMGVVGSPLGQGAAGWPHEYVNLPAYSKFWTLAIDFVTSLYLGYGKGYLTSIEH